MSTKTRDIMSQYCARMSRADPEAWDQFVVAFELYSIEAMQGLTGAPQDAILNMQGRAQQCEALLRMFRECNRTPQTQSQEPPATQ